MYKFTELVDWIEDYYTICPLWITVLLNIVLGLLCLNPLFFLILLFWIIGIPIVIFIALLINYIVYKIICNNASLTVDNRDYWGLKLIISGITLFVVGYICVNNANFSLGAGFC